MFACELLYLGAYVNYCECLCVWCMCNYIYNRFIVVRIAPNLERALMCSRPGMSYGWSSGCL